MLSFNIFSVRGCRGQSVSFFQKLVWLAKFSISQGHIGPLTLEKLQSYIPSRVNLLYPLCYEIPCNTGPSEPRPDCKGCKHRNQAFNLIRPWITTCFPSKFLPFYRSCYPIAKHTSIRLTYTHLQFSEVFDNKQMTVTL